MLIPQTKKVRELYNNIGLIPLTPMDLGNLDNVIRNRELALQKLRRQSHLAGARDDLLDFTIATYDQGEFLENWHIRKMCDLLMEFEKPESSLDRLIITMPPRSTKSEICTRRFPAWCLGRQPRQRPVVIGSYAASLAEDFSSDIQGIISGEEYQLIFPDVTINPRKHGVQKWALNDYAQNACMAIGRRGSITGKGGGIMILDDPVKDIHEARSETIREVVWQWYLSTYRTRLEPNAKVLIVMTRWDEDDLVARIKALMEVEPDSDQFFIYNLPAIATENDEYRLKGEALHPARYSVKELRRTRATMGERLFNSLYQGTPIAPEGNVFKRSWFNSKNNPAIHFSQLPEKRVRIRYWDWAVTPDGGDFTVGSLLGKDSTMQVYLENVVRGQWEWSKAAKRIFETAMTDGKDVVVGIEEIAKDAIILKQLKRKLRSAGFTVFINRTRQKKVVEAKYFESLAEAGMITMVRGHWYPAWISEVTAFPFGTHDDQIDSVSGGLKWLRTAKISEYSRKAKRAIREYKSKKPVYGNNEYKNEKKASVSTEVGSIV